MPHISFDLNLATIFSPMLAVIFAYLVNKAKVAVTDHMDENKAEVKAEAAKQHQENSNRLERIELQTQATNGKVAEHDKTLTMVQAKQEVLMEMMLGRQPDRGA